MSVPMKPDDPAYFMLFDEHTTTPVIHREGCYICEDPEFAQMGLPLCRICPSCQGHIPADDTICDDCDYDEFEAYEARKVEEYKKHLAEIENDCA